MYDATEIFRTLGTHKERVLHKTGLLSDLLLLLPLPVSAKLQVLLRVLGNSHILVDPVE